MEHAIIVNHGVDTLIVNAYCVDTAGRPRKGEPQDSLVKQLEEWKREAQEMGEPVATSWMFQGVHLLMRPNGAGRGHWQWLLTSHLLNVNISRGRWNGGIAQVRFSSEYLWSSSSLEEAIKQVHQFLEAHFACELFLQVSEVHLCVDVAGWTGIRTLDYQHDFISRARQRRTHEVADWNFEPGEAMDASDFSYGLKRTGLRFSPKGTLSCLIYEKSRELKQSGKEWFEDKWLANDWDGIQPVWRVEFRFEREALHELSQEGAFHGIENVYDLPGKLAVLWAYAAGHVGGDPDGLPDGWLRCVVPQTGDSKRSRWPVHPVWEVIQGAFQQGSETPEQFGEVVRKRHYEHNIRKGLEGIMGYATSLASWVGGELAHPEADLSVFLHWLAIHGQEYLKERDVSFGAEVQRKQILQGVKN
ncbi:MAG TPA: hypothetical protein VFV38_15165, partial [Ktedonobacteraceae bacterium]|nr:hypothetical protein [Ktedonobacteraceae bacterium]